jgi:hypothetical protein
MGNLASFLSEINYFRMRRSGEFRLLISRRFFAQAKIPFRMAHRGTLLVSPANVHRRTLGADIASGAD